MLKMHVENWVLACGLILGFAGCSADDNGTGGSQQAGGGFGNASGTGGGSAGFGNGSGGASGSQAVSTGGTVSHMGMGCATADIQAARVTPKVWLVVDGSGSMCDMLDATNNRWEALLSVLMDPTAGVVKTLEAAVVWGMLIYDAPLLPGLPIPTGCSTATLPTSIIGDCPRLVVVEPALNNFAAIDAQYPKDASLGGTTPTHKALDALAMRLEMEGQMPVLDANVGPTYVVLATDGAPNEFCGTASGTDPQSAVVAATQRLVAANAKVYVVSLAAMDQNLNAHLQQVAMAGDTGKPPFVPADKDALVQAFNEIIGGAVGCDVRLNGKVTAGSECLGYVRVNGVDLPCNDPNGWRLKDPQTVEITGTACDSFKLDKMAMLHASFPCDVFVPD